MASGRRQSRAAVTLIVLLTTSIFINYVDRSNLSVAAPLLQKDPGYSLRQIGILSSGFFWTYSLFQLLGISGWVADRFSAGKVFAFSFLLWSVVTAASGLVWSFAAFFLMRLLLGLGESFAYPCYSRLIAQEIPQRMRGRANALLDSCSAPARSSSHFCLRRSLPSLARSCGEWLLDLFAKFPGRPAVNTPLPELEALVATAKSLFARGYSFGTAGNISIRFGDSVYATPTGSSFQNLSSGDLALCDLHGNVLGPNKPTKELSFHLAAYRARRGAGAVVHLHSTNATAIACLRTVDMDDALPALTAYYAMRVRALAVVPYLPLGDPLLGAHVEELAARAVEAIHGIRRDSATLQKERA